MMTKPNHTTPVVGKPVPHDSAEGHVRGDAPYIDDFTPMAGELIVGFAGSPCARGTIESVDTSAAIAVPGIVGVFTVADIPGHNRFGPIVADEPFLVDKEVAYLGQPVVVIAAESHEALRKAVSAVKIKANDEPPVLTIEEAIKRGEFLTDERIIAHGDAEIHLAGAPMRIRGTMSIGGQEQFYLESQAAIAYPGENGQVVIHSSTQNPTETQQTVAEVMGLGMHEVVCVCKRMGGGFGGKETQGSIPAMMAALVAARTGRAARCVYGKALDMQVTGKRHAYRAVFDVGFGPDGRIHAVKLSFHSNGGAFIDLSPSVMDRTLLHADNAYYFPHVEIRGRVCRTNLPPNTAFRGFGGPQGAAVIESLMEEIASQTGLDPAEVRRVNLYGGDGRDTTPYGQKVTENTLPELMDKVIASSDYAERRIQVDAHNAANPQRIRGLAVTMVKFGISFTTRFLNQGNSLVNIYHDGTIQVSTGATEMGQGVNTKIRQIVADEFGLPLEAVVMMPTSTEKNNNTSPTAASASTDLNGFAALDACHQIKNRMAEFAAHMFEDKAAGRAAHPESICFKSGQVFDSRSPDKALAFGDFCRQCRLARVDIGARGFYATPGVDMNKETGRGNPFYYFTSGAAVSEVSIDRYTGELVVERVDLLMDIGRMINPAVDNGQVIGGFIQGMGWTILEELVYSDRGELLSDSPTTYKVPGISDVPRDFRVAYLDNPRNTRNIYASKAVGEPPLLLGLSPWAAAKNALGYLSARSAQALRLPATNEELLRCMELASAPLTQAERVAAEEMAHAK